ncbi:MAG: ribbon-helix-helix protein, CopG family [Rickettsiaceae bacterium]|nr:ribbon-helix-helix protein, CopG family [Rickettsiaceae bacterium]
MTIITARIPKSLNESLNELAHETSRTKGYIVQRAIENYLEEKADILIALSRIEKGDTIITLEEIEKKYGLED